MTDKTHDALVAALDAHLGDDISANTLVIARTTGPDLAIIRADILEVLKTKAAAFDANGADNEEADDDAFTLLDRSS
ncbi:hypothetical protein ACOI1H_14895 [Loktanella sp. DJP18]|uniref:hypothetical protein n=1 Tax=Loktanella sp. DJP18 TaxID=3409788 RepID=UPI003BB4E589